MHLITARLRLALVTLAFIGALTLSGVIAQKPHGGIAGGVSAGFIQGWPIKYFSVGKLHLDDISLGVITDKTR